MTTIVWREKDGVDTSAAPPCPVAMDKWKVNKVVSRSTSTQRAVVLTGRPLTDLMTVLQARAGVAQKSRPHRPLRIRVDPHRENSA